MRSLATRTTLNTAKFVATLAVVLFVSAGTLRFWQAWLFLALNLVWLVVAGAYFRRRDPALVERRLIQDEQGEKETVQKIVIAIMRVLGAAMLIVAGLDRRHGWSNVPPARALRHPMYAGTLLMGLATPLILGSYWAALLLPPGWVVLIVRILAEERLLSVRLTGYAQYMSRTRHRLIPGVW